MRFPRKPVVLVGIATICLMVVVIVASHNESLETAKTLPPVETTVVSTQAESQPVVPTTSSAPKRQLVAPSAPIHNLTGSVATTTPNAESRANNGDTYSSSTGGLHFATGPTNGRSAVQTSMNRMLQRSPEIMQRNLGPVDPNSLKIQSPLAVYNLEVDAIAIGKGLETAQKADLYRYLIESSGKYVITVGVQEDASGNGHAVSFEDDEYGPSMIAGLQQLATRDLVTSGSYEARIAQMMPGLFSPENFFLWLKSSTASPDLIYIPNQPFLPDTLRAGQVYTATEFLQIAQPMAQQKVEMLSGPSGRRGS